METFLLVSTILVWIVVLANLVLTLALIRRVNASPGPLAGIETGLPVGTSAPDFSAKTLEGQNVTLADYIGRPTTFVFVGTHCEPCHALLPRLKPLVPQARAAGTTFVLVSDGEKQETEKMMQVLEGQVEVILAPRFDHTLFTDYHINLTPSYCSLDEKGVITWAGSPDSSDQGWQHLLTAWSQQVTTTNSRR
jgi:cytochrome c biogenesis protein CcmG/thiol:disulfide interchange protein DsbE